MRTLLGALATALVLLAGIPASEATPLRILHVAPSGDDGNDGTAAAPWRTLQHAADRVRAGDLVMVHPGRYAGFDLQTSGTAAHPIVFWAAPGAVIDTPGPVRTMEGINLEGASWVVIEGFTVTGMPRAGIRSVLNHHVAIRRNVADANGRWGIFSGFSDDLTIEDNVASRSEDEHGIYVSNSGDRPVIRRNHVWGNRACGVHMNGDLSMGGDGLISGALVEANLVHGNGRGGGSGINADGVQDSRFVNNVLWDNHASGLSLYRIDGAAGSTGNLVAHNTIVQPADARWAVNIAGGSTGNRVVDNVLLTAHPWRGAISVDASSLPGFVSRDNAVTPRFTLNGGDTVLDLAGWRAATGQERRSFATTAAALFVDPAGADFRLRPDAPARDAGRAVAGVATDFEGTPRPRGPRPDIGADEYGGAVAPAVAAWGPDLVVTRLTTPPATAAPGASFTVTDTVRNRGGWPADPSTTRYYLSLDATRGSGDRLLGGNRAVPELAPGATSRGTARLKVPAATPPGTYHLIACADQRRAVPEADETNNCRAATGTVTITP